jgi:hypothetical protein
MAWTFYNSSGEAMIEDGAMTIANNTNDRVVTATGADPASLNGEANLTFDGTNLTVGTGNVVIGTAGKGIDFSAQTGTGSGTVVSELLDHYEEGTWTPLVQDQNLDDRSQAYGARYGRYQKVGNLVHISGKVTMTSLGTLTGASGTRIAGLPFTSSSTTSNEQGIVATYSEGLAMTANASVTGRIYINTTYAYMFEWDATIGVGGDGLTLTELSADGLLEFFGSYVV